ncbi:MAG: helix-turn-helix transcriptional regulator [Chloroflexota bacterium]
MNGSKRHDRTARLNRICQLLYEYPQGVTPKRLAELCEVSVRTVFRDLHAIQRDPDYPIWQEGGRYGLERRAFLPPLKLTLPEAMTLFLAARLVSRYSDERDPTIASAFGKLAAVLPRPVAQHVAETVGGMLVRPENPQYARVFEILSTAWASGRAVRIWYPQSGGGPPSTTEERLVEPYFLEPSQIGHSCYLIAFCHHAGALRTFKLERIRHIELTEEAYLIPASFDPNDYLKASWGVVADEEVEVRLRFSPTVARRMKECTWHPSQRVGDLPDGRLDFAVTVAGTMEITPWILSWGAEVEVLAPEQLRAKVADIATRMRTTYIVGSEPGVDALHQTGAPQDRSHTRATQRLSPQPVTGVCPDKPVAPAPPDPGSPPSSWPQVPLTPASTPSPPAIPPDSPASSPSCLTPLPERSPCSPPSPALGRPVPRT